MEKYCRGVREYVVDGRKYYDIIVIQWNERNQWYDIRTADGVLQNNNNFEDDIFGQWAYTIAAAKRKALQDSGLTVRDFDWEERVL